ncbi:MAG: amidohydrolase, partial [bacterium]|nr:amidohydrolase [bacterium]
MPDPVSPQRCDLLLEGGTLVTLDPARPVIDSGFVAISGERIVGVGESSTAPVYRADRVISCRGRLVMPGL